MKQTARFLTDWRKTLNDLYTNNFYGRMAALAHQNKLKVTYETAAGDVIPVIYSNTSNLLMSDVRILAAFR
jgi:homoserine dehydrogenase